MAVERDKVLVKAVYRSVVYSAEVPVDASVGLLGKQLSEATGIVLSTMRLLVPKGKRVLVGGGGAIEPGSEQHCSLTVDECGITPGVVIRMMGVTAVELKEVSKPVKDDRVLGFAEEEERKRLRGLPATQGDAKSRLPKGPYTFHAFRTCDLPEWAPPRENALAILYKLASDPGIVGIMNKHKWQVGVLSELPPKGYVGISPVCLLGQNMNRGQDISLRLRTDDLNGFRKYPSIKATLLHELTHMVHDDHDEKFLAFLKQLTQEASELDWTSSGGHRLTGVAGRSVEADDALMDAVVVKSGRKLIGGLPTKPNAKFAAIEAALLRREQSKQASVSSGVDPYETAIQVGSLPESQLGVEFKWKEPDPDEDTRNAADIARRPQSEDDVRVKQTPDDESIPRPSSQMSSAGFRERDPDPDGTEAMQSDLELSGKMSSRGFEEPDPDDMLTQGNFMKITRRLDPANVAAEPDPDDSATVRNEAMMMDVSPHWREEPDPDDESEKTVPYNSVNSSRDIARDLKAEIQNGELLRIMDATTAAVTRLQHAVMHVRQQATPAETTITLRTLATILRNVLNNPSVNKYKHIRTGNRRFHEDIGRFEGAMEFLRVVGFSEGESTPGAGDIELRTLDPGLLWVGLSILEQSPA